MNVQDAQKKIIEKALKDPAFRKALQQDANAAIEKELGTKLPAGLKIKVVEDGAAAVHLVLPAAAAKGEISDKDLGQVSGGAGIVFPGQCAMNTGS